MLHLVVNDSNVDNMRKNEEGVGKVMYYRSKGLSFREIARLLGKDLKTVYRWHSYLLTTPKKQSRTEKGR